MKSAWTDDLHVLFWFFCLSILSVLGSSLLCKAHTCNIVTVLIKPKTWIQEKFQQNLRSKFASKDVCTSPVRNILNAVTCSSSKTNTYLEQVVFLNNMLAPSWIILAGLGPGYCSPAQVKAVQLGNIQSFPVKRQGNILHQEHYCPYWLWNVLPPKCFPESLAPPYSLLTTPSLPLQAPFIPWLSLIL